MGEDRFALTRQVLLDAIRPAFTTLAEGGLAAEELLFGTAIQESLLIHRQQLGGGPALGLFQMETATHNWNNYLKSPSELANRVKQMLCGGGHVSGAVHASAGRAASRERYRGNGKLLEGALQILLSVRAPRKNF